MLGIQTRAHWMVSADGSTELGMMAAFVIWIYYYLYNNVFDKYCTIDNKVKNQRRWIRTRGHPMESTDGSTDLWRALMKFDFTTTYTVLYLKKIVKFREIA